MRRIYLTPLRIRAWSVAVAALLLCFWGHAWAEPQVTDGAFTPELAGGEPAQYLENVPSSIRELYYYSVVTGLQGQTIKHYWKLNGKTMQVVEIKIDSDMAKAISKITLDPTWLGAWTVETVTDSGQVIGESDFAYLSEP